MHKSLVQPEATHAANNYEDSEKKREMRAVGVDFRPNIQTQSVLIPGNFAFFA